MVVLGSITPSGRSGVVRALAKALSDVGVGVGVGIGKRQRFDRFFVRSRTVRR